MKKLMVMQLLLMILFIPTIAQQQKVAIAIGALDTISVTIGDQIWLNRNLNVDKFANGDPIPYAPTSEEWRLAGNNKQPAWCYYNNDSTNGSIYGKLYNWYAVNDPRGLAPKGWHVPNYYEWNVLLNYLDRSFNVGKHLKTTQMWSNYYGMTGNGKDRSGFDGRPGGARVDNTTFLYVGKAGYWWSSSEQKADQAMYCLLDFMFGKVIKGSYYMNSGFSVRCVKN